MSDLLAKEIRCLAQKNDKTRALPSKFLRKVISTESEYKTLHFLPLRSKIALVPPIFELDL